MVKGKNNVMNAKIRQMFSETHTNFGFFYEFSVIEINKSIHTIEGVKSMRR